MQIESLKLYTSNLLEQIEFYNNVLNFEMLEKNEFSCSFKIGSSILQLEHRDHFTPYHYAINIPSNDKEKALQWLKERVDILKDGENEIQYFDFWDAHAIYFYDKDNNIVEFISRKKRNIISEKEFDVNSIIEISEIGLPTENIKTIFEILNKGIGVKIHSGDFDRFCAIGDESGLVICIDKNLKKNWYPTEDTPYESDFVMGITNNNSSFDLVYKNKILVIEKH